MLPDFNEMRARLRATLEERMRAIAGSRAIREAAGRVRGVCDRAVELIGRHLAPVYGQARAWYVKREQRERLLLRVLGGIVAAFMLYDFFYVPISGLGGDLTDRIAARQHELVEVRGLMSSYDRLKVALAATEKRTVPGKDFSLFSIIEQTLTKSIGRDRIGSITPSDHPVPGGFQQYTVDLKLTALNLAQIVDTLYGVQTLPMPVTVSNLHIRQTAPGSRAYDVDLTCIALGRNE
jgi:hypothetical protein